MGSGLNFVLGIYEVNERALRNKECGVRARDWGGGGVSWCQMQIYPAEERGEGGPGGRGWGDK